MAHDPTTSALTLPPMWLAHRYDPDHDAFHFVSVDRARRQSAPFLTDEHLPDTASPLIVARGEAMAVAGPPAPLHFIFHSAYCCSTLLANAMDRDGVASSFKEPVVLNDIVGWRHRGGDPAKVGAALDNALTMISRSFAPGEASVVKPSNVANGLATAMMTMRPDARAILLYAPLRSFLASIARKGMWGRLWVRELFSRQYVDGLVDFGFEQRDYLLQTDLQIAAIGWLCQHKLFAEMAGRWPDRVRTLNSETLVARPVEALDAGAALFGLSAGAGDTATVVDAVFGRNAKDGSAFSPGQRDDDRRIAEVTHGEEIEKVAVWAQTVASSAGIGEELPNPLLV